MRLTRLFGMSLLGSLAFAGCGDDGGSGGGGSHPDAPKQIDAAIDAPSVPCPPATFGAGTFGTMAAPMPGNFVHNSQQAGTFLQLGLLVSQDMTNAFTIVWPKPAAGFAAGTFTFDTSPTSAMPAALSFFEGGLNPSDPMADAAHFLWASSGTLTIASVSKTGAMPAGENANDVFVGSVSAVTYKEIDDNNMVIPGGCTVMIGGVSFGLKDPDGLTTIQPAQDSHNWRDAHAQRAPLQPLAQ